MDEYFSLVLMVNSLSLEEQETMYRDWLAQDNNLSMEIERTEIRLAILKVRLGLRTSESLEDELNKSLIMMNMEDTERKLKYLRSMK